MTELWKKIQLGNKELKNRLVMAPMTRSRAEGNGVPGDFAPEYYAQRASMGLVISEGVQPSDEGQGYLATPGIYTAEQVDGWKEVADAVHSEDGTIFLQLMHVGRIAHPDNIPNHKQAVAPSAIASGEAMFTSTGMQDMPVPHELSKEEIKETIEDYRKAAAFAIQAGADGVEIHGANGYLIHQFLGENSNTRTDNYGGSIENRARFALEVAKAVVEEIGAERTGFRISPMNFLGGVVEGENGEELYNYLVTELNQLNLAYLHIMHVGREELLKTIRNSWKTILIVNRPGRDLSEISLDVDAGLADMVSVGVWSLANPDLVERLKTGAPLNDAIPQTFYVKDGALGYTDYPTLEQL